MQNLPIYLLIALFLAVLGLTLRRRNKSGFRHYRAYLLMLLPALLLPLLGAAIGARYLPRHELVIRGYKVPLQTGTQKLYIGSDPRDQLVLHHRSRDRENIEPGLIELEFLGNRQCRITQTVPDSPNVVSIDGLPLRTLELQPGQIHRITFAAFDHRDDDQHTLFLDLPKVRSIAGDIVLAKPRFRFRGVSFVKGFSHDSWLLPNFAMNSGELRHLAYRGRVFHKGLDSPTGNILRQAALLRRGTKYYLVANDAQIRLNGQDFPNSIVVDHNADLTFESLQLGGNRFASRMRLIQPKDQATHAYFELDPKYQRRLKLPPVEVADRICLAANPSAYTQAYDILDDQFPTRGTVISREDQRFVFRGEALQPDRNYTCGKVVFSLESVRMGHLMAPALYGLLFLLSALFVPPTLVRRVPLLGPLVATAIFLSALRQLFAFRAWLGPPYNVNVFLDSAAAPYLFVLCVVALTSRAPFFELFTSLFVHLRNLLLPNRTRPVPLARDRDGATATLALLLYGVILYALFARYLDAGFLLAVAFFVLISALLGPLGALERHLSARPVVGDARSRYQPVLGMVALFVLAALAAPLMGGHEIIPILPGRIRPDIFIQVILLLITAYLAGIWEREKRNRVVPLLAVLIIYSGMVGLPFFQGVLASDMGFFLVVVCPLVTVLLMASWTLDRRIPLLVGFSVVVLLGLILFFQFYQYPLDGVSAQRLAFWLDKPRLRSEHFFEYQAQIPILWSSSQGWFGGGYFQGDWYPALRGTAVNDNVAAVFVQGELGGIGTILTMFLYVGLCLAGLLFVRDARERVGGFRIWLVTGIALTFVWTATAMFLQNLGWMPLTGKNLPFLGLDSLNDTIRYGLLTGLMARYMREVEE